MNAKAAVSDRLDTAERRSLEKSDYGLPDRCEFPMPDAAHVRAAEAYFRYAPQELKPLLAHRILLKASRYGVDVRSSEVRDMAARYKA